MNVACKNETRCLLDVRAPTMNILMFSRRRDNLIISIHFTSFKINITFPSLPMECSRDEVNLLVIGRMRLDRIITANIILIISWMWIEFSPRVPSWKPWQNCGHKTVILQCNNNLWWIIPAIYIKTIVVYGRTFDWLSSQTLLVGTSMTILKLDLSLSRCSLGLSLSIILSVMTISCSLPTLTQLQYLTVTGLSFLVCLSSF